MIFKLIGLGPKAYSQDAFNVFDASVVTISLIDFSLTRALGGNLGSVAGVMKAFRALRLCRVVKLARRWTAL